ncbi:MAG: helicase SNF2, partial [Planctomycetaceae bacterium]
MTLAELLEPKFRADVRFRGAAYLKAERVAITRVTPDDVFALVSEGVEYHTQLSRADGELKMYCNCEQFSKQDACKHLWGTILAVDEGDLLSGSAKAGYVPPFAAEPDEFDWDIDVEELPGDVFHPPPSRSNGRSIQVETRLRPWEAKLKDMRQQLATREPAAPAAGREREIFYLIDAAQSREAGQLVLQTSQRQRRASGQWGKLKPL